MKKNVKTYLRIIAFFYLAALFLLPVVYGARLFFSLTGCASFAHPGWFPAGCAKSLYDDYEHQAFYFGLEPEAVKSLQAAEVMFLGDSRTQYGFSSGRLDEFFHENGWHYYIAGFGQNDLDVFSAAVLKKYKVRPRVLIINASPFFKGYISGIGREILDHPVKMFFQGVVKRVVYRIHSAVCAKEGFCDGSRPAVYRSAANGMWQATGFRQENKPVRISSSDTGKADAETILNARHFIEDVPVDSGCVILTATPSPDTKPKTTAAVAAELGFSFVYPEVSGLRWFDNVHLDQESADRWSAEFLRAAEPILKKCLD